MKAITIHTILLILCPFFIYPQAGIYNAGTLIHTNQGALIHVEGDIINTPTSVLENDGVIELMGDLTNDSTAFMVNGSDSTSTERVYKFVGTGAQVIAGNIADINNRYFYNLLIDKSGPGTAVSLQTNAYVKGSLVFGSNTSGAATYVPTVVSTLTNNSNMGVIQTYDPYNNDYELYIANPAVNAVAGYAPLVMNGAPLNSYVETRGAQGIGLGGFSRNVSAINVPYVFPVGTASHGYNATGITFKSIASGFDKVRGMFIDAPGGVGYLSQYCSGCGTNAQDNNGFNYYFNVDSCNGAPQWVVLDALPNDHGYWSYAGNAGDTYYMETYPNSFAGFGGKSTDTWRTIKKSGNISDIPTGDWTAEIVSSVSSVADLLTYTLNTACYTGNGIPGGKYSGFAHYQMSRAQTGNVLPVELLYLTAAAVNNKFIKLEWATALEINNSGFEILRSRDGIDFANIGWADAAGNGNSTVERNYFFNDTGVVGGLYYYKLKQFDNNGTYKETYIVSAQLNNDAALSVSPCFPNPAVDHSGFRIQSPSPQILQFELYDINGRLVLKKEINATIGETRFDFITTYLAAGVYKTLLRSDKEIFTGTVNVINY